MAGVVSRVDRAGIDTVIPNRDSNVSSTYLIDFLLLIPIAPHASFLACDLHFSILSWV